MKRTAFFACMMAAVLLLAGCPGNSRTGQGSKPATLDGWHYSPVHPDVVAGEVTLDVDAVGDVKDPPIPCGGDEDCPEDMVCEPGTGVCIECFEDFHCHAGQMCIDQECADMLVCSEEAPDCPKGFVCDFELGLCVPCISDEDCPEGFECVDHVCEEKKPPCETTEDCPADMFCNIHTFECVFCLEDGHCPLGQWCEIEEGECITDLCEPGVKVCVSGGLKECKQNGSGYGETIVCPDGTVCEDGECVPIQVCVPGESYCTTQFSLKVCGPQGTMWQDVQCPANSHCEDLEDGHATCVEQCIPVCTLPINHCGPDVAGCKTLCDACQPGYDCPDGAIGLPPGQSVPCEDLCSCEGKSCGDDGCGGMCGECKAGYICQANQCVYLGYTCEEGYECVKSCSALPNDQCVQACIAGTGMEQQGLLIDFVECIKSYCGGFVQPGCVEEVAETACEKYAAMCLTCQPECFGKECGDNGCGGICDVCPVGFECKDYKCVGQGGCDEILGCIENSEAPPDVSIPMCMGQATPDAQAQFLKLANCVQDTCNEFQPSSDCYYLAIQTGCADVYKECKDCVPYCTGKECGQDGCGGWCGFCALGYDCDNGKCVCIPECGNKECGSDGCGNLCGKCKPGFKCSPWGTCDCTPDCVAKDCGDDGCGGSCGLCLPGLEFCTEKGTCISFDCKPGMMDCDGNVQVICSADGAWISLGPCPDATYCSDGMCMPWECFPGSTQCIGNGIATCAANGGGWLAPELCPAGTQCKGGKCVPVAGCGDIPKMGCCDGTMFMVCGEDGSIAVEECGDLGCGWIPNWGYGCGGFGPDPSGQHELACPGACEPQCITAEGTLKECGPDGCGEVCGLCAPDFVCVDGHCDPFCLPNCAGKECGSDGCQGACGICAGDEICHQGQCLVPPTCNSMMDCAIGCFPMGDTCFDLCTQGAQQDEQYYAEFKNLWGCAMDICAPASDPNCFKNALFGACYQQYLACVSCTPGCANSQCGPDGCGGSCGECGDMEECYDGICESVCIANCILDNGQKKECGDNGCGGQCGVCKPGYECDGAFCIYICKPQCVGKECGPDTCGGQCGFCQDGLECTPQGQCIPGTICGDGICEMDEGENCFNCQGDCGACSNGCESTPFPGCGGCICEECVCGMDPFCCEVQWDEICVEQCKECGGCCEANCAGKQCGPDSCGGSCGQCPEDYECNAAGKCDIVCKPDCDGKECGPDECGGTCGTCPNDATCKNNICFYGKPCGELVQCSLDCVEDMGAECLFGCLEQGTPEAQDEFFEVVQCILWQCGLDLSVECMVGAMAGPCQAAYAKCQDCSPDCTAKECGPNGCGGSCGICSAGYYCDNYKCKPDCTGSCVGKECGDNGCGGSCGQCGADEECQAGVCIPVCIPNCVGKQCGSNGCGGLCGVCPPSFICQNFMCLPVGPICGDAECDFWDGETCQSCPEDCGPCGDGCSPTDYPGCGGCKCEECVCAMDSYCCDTAWDGICVSECQECGGCGCQPQCDNKECGTDGCGGDCGFCGKYEQCQSGVCVPVCVPNCLGKQCGSNGCNGSCGQCPQGFKCDADSTCVPVCVPDCAGKKCGPDGCNGQCGLCGPDEVCQTGNCKTAWDCELLLNCGWDCPEDDETCFDACWSNASPEAQEQYMMIWQCILEVCGPQPVEPCPGEALLNGECQDEFYACLDCTPSCTGKQCGSDGCNGSCGECPPGYDCDPFGYCDCMPSCDGKQCGNDGCGGDCGQCSQGFICNVWGQCICMPQCGNVECGGDGCGGSCGQCAPGFDCQGGKCIQGCVPQCVSEDGMLKQCGPNGCGGSCGFCPPGLICTPQGQCQQQGPVCGNNQCQQQENCYTCPQDCGQCKGNCCEAHDGVGCEDPEVTACVCEMDFFCCDSNWDGICANLAEDQCKADCGCTPNCDNKQCGGDGCGGVCGWCAPGSWCDADGQCIVVCEPKCDGKQCGPDGCGGQCGNCAVGETCNSLGQCVCVPNCNNKACGPDGCGGSCGECGQWQTCTPSGQCKFVTPLCGDGNCMGMIGEDCDACPQDCGVCCGNGMCEGSFNESCQTCQADCGECCGNNFCEAQYGETCGSCPQDCGPCPAVCGDGLCSEDKGETCTNCPQDCGLCPSKCGDGNCKASDDETCVTCAQDCGWCEGDCCQANGTPGCEDPEIQACVCEMDDYCCNVQWDSICADAVEGLDCGQCQQPGCGDGWCAFNEDCQSCPGDCGKCCGNGQCEDQYGESCNTCPTDCGACPGEDSCCLVHDSPGCADPDIEQCVCANNPICCFFFWDESCTQMAQDCGSCDGDCCQANESPGCEDPDVMQCVCAQVPECCVKPWESYCVSAVEKLGCGKCGCVPNCNGKECGNDGCGGSCGQCPAGQECTVNGTCTGGQQLSCSEVLSCAVGCGGDMQCMWQCNSNGTPEAQQLFLGLMSCVVETCGVNPSTQCLIQSFMFGCSQEYQACQADN